MPELMKYLADAIERHASDVLFVAGSPVNAKLNGQLECIGDDVLMPAMTESIVRDMYDLAGRPIAHFIEEGDDDFSFSKPGLARFRVNVYRQRGSMAAVVRIVSHEIPDWKSINIPEEVIDIANVPRGLVLFAGPSGGGKTTTQTCIIDHINRNLARHIITLENPIEYLHKNKKSIVSQREVTNDAKDYLSALRSTLRQAPDVIMMSEMRGPQLIQNAMIAAGNGHLVISVVNARSAAHAIERVVEVFPRDQRELVCAQLADVLHTVVYQQLYFDTAGHATPKFEILRVDENVCQLIREGSWADMSNPNNLRGNS